MLRLIFPSFYSDREREEVLNTVFNRPLISFDFSSRFENPGSPSKWFSSMLRSTSERRVLIEKFLADSLTSEYYNFSYLLSNLGELTIQVLGIYLGIPFLGFIKSWLSICSKVNLLLGSTTKIFLRRSLALGSLK
jgi:hypothetical protein